VLIDTFVQDVINPEDAIEKHLGGENTISSVFAVVGSWCLCFGKYKVRYGFRTEGVISGIIH